MRTTPGQAGPARLRGPALRVTPHTVAMAQVVQSLQGALQRGLPAPALLRRAGIPPALLSSPLSRVTQDQYAALIRVLRRTTRDELWGLCASPLVPGSFAHACRLLIHSATLGDALQQGFSLFHLLLHDFVPRLHNEHGVVTWSMVSTRERDPRLTYAERLFCFFAYGLACWLVGRRIPLLELVYPPSEAVHDCGDARRMFEAPVRYSEGPVRLRFDSRWMALPIVQNPQGVQEFLRRSPRDLLIKYRDRASIGDRVRRELRRHMTGEMPTLEAVASALAMSPKTLARRLQGEGQQYRAIKNELRRDMAIDLLRRPQLSLLEIALQVGFSESSAFHRAFKAWTGLPPGLYRQNTLGGTPAS